MQSITRWRALLPLMPLQAEFVSRDPFTLIDQPLSADSTVGQYSDRWSLWSVSPVPTDSRLFCALDDPLCLPFCLFACLYQYLCPGVAVCDRVCVIGECFCPRASARVSAFVSLYISLSRSVFS